MEGALMKGSARAELPSGSYSGLAVLLVQANISKKGPLMEDRALVARLKGLVTTMPDEPTKRACLEALRWLFATADLFQLKAPGGEMHCGRQWTVQLTRWSAAGLEALCWLSARADLL